MKGGTLLEIFGRGFRTSLENGPTVRFHCQADPDASFATLLKKGQLFSPFYNMVNAPVSNPNVVPATILSDSVLRCTTPSVTCSGIFDVSVALNGYDFHSDGAPPAGGPALHFEFYPSPQLQLLEPLGGPITGFTTVITRGVGLKIYAENPMCKFGPGTDDRGNLTGMNLVVQKKIGKATSDETFVCQSPSRLRPGMIRISIALNGVDFEPVGWIPFTFYREPVVSILSPAGGPSVGGTIVVVRGSGFLDFPLGGKLTCRFAQTVVLSDNTTTNTRSVCIVPKNLAGTASVKFSLNGQDYGSRVFFSYYDLPILAHSIPMGGPPSRNLDKSTSVHVKGQGFLRFHGNPLCRFGCAFATALVIDDSNLECRAPWPVDNYHLFLDDCASASQEQRLQCDSSDCTSNGCKPSSTVETLNISCVLDTWLEISLNGVDFTSNSNLNYRYYHQPTFHKFGPSGGPVTGNTVLEVLTDSMGGFQRLNDGSVTLNIGGGLVVCEEEPGETVMIDDFDPLPPELHPSDAQIITITNFTALLEDVLADNLESYIFDKEYWETGEGLQSDTLCGGIAQDALVSAVIDVGNIQGFGARLANFTELSASLHFTGKTSNALVGRHALSRGMDLARGALVHLSVRRGEDKWPGACEAPDLGDDLHLLLRTEAYTNGVSVPRWYERELWTSIQTFSPFDPKLAGSTFVPYQLRLNASRHILGTKKPVQNMIDCLRNQPCNASLGRVALLQPNHGSGPYDVWAIDNLEIIAYGGISSDKRTVCRSPPTDIGIGNAEVTLALNGQQFSTVGAGNPAGQTKFIYYAEPIIESIRPSGGPAGGGTFITLIGSGFTNFKDDNYPPKCKFGIQTTLAIVISDDVVECPLVRDTVYTGFATVSLALNGVDFTPGPVQYIYYLQPMLYTVYPNSGPARGGTDVNVIGHGFIYLTPFPASCKFTSIHDPDSSIITAARYLNDSLLACQTPNATAWYKYKNVTQLLRKFVIDTGCIFERAFYLK